MTVNEFYKYHCRGRLKIMSGYNGKVLCRAFDPKKHGGIGERKITAVWAQLEASKMSGFQNHAVPIMCAYVNGVVERNRELTEETDNE